MWEEIEIGFEKQSIVITGGANGIGRAAAIKFANKGANVTIIDLNEEAMATTIKEVERRGVKGLAIKADVSNEDDVKRAYQQINEKWGTVHILLNSAAMIMPKNVEDTTSEEWDKIFQVNTKSVFLNCKYALPELKVNRGNIVNMASMNGLIGQKSNTAYAGTKGAIIAMTKAMAIDYAPYGVRINCICAAGVATSLLEQWFLTKDDPKKAREELAKAHMLGYIAKPEELADTVLYLTSNKASFITGQAIQVEGGASLGYGAGPKPEWN